MPVESKRTNKREALLSAGIDEISRSGITGFSMRHAAQEAGVSCAAPARHFGDKQGYIAAIIDYVNGKWHDEQMRILAECGPTTREKLVAFSVGYIKFLVEKPRFRSILTLKDENLDNTYHSRGKTTSLTLELVAKYCSEVGMDDKTRLRKLYIVRSLIYGASLMFDNGELPYTEENLNIVERSIDREFELP